MNTVEHTTAPGGEHVHDEQNGHKPALIELRRRLADGLARSPLNQTLLARQAKLGRTTVSEALSPRKPVPSAETVAALAGPLKLPVQELLDLQRTAAEESGTVTTVGPGRLIGEWEPHDLEVHPAGPRQTASGAGASGTRALPGYVLREHDRVLAEAVRDMAAGRSRIVILVGTSSTGKTRACWEAVQPLAEKGWRLWHPFDPTRAEAALEDLRRVQPCTVVWLNEAQHYLGDRAAGERIAAAVHHLLVSPERGPVQVLGTLWPEYVHQYTALPAPNEEDPHSRVRELLSGHTLTVPDAFDATALAAATALAKDGDHLLSDALTRASSDGRITQDLAGAPELLNRYQHASPAARALLEAAMDARRLGIGLHLSQAFLIDAATDYLNDTDYDQLADDWAEQAFATLAQPVHGKQAPLRRTTPRATRRPPIPSLRADTPASPPAGPVFRLADYLEQHGRSTRSRLCPPASFWHAAHTRLTQPDDLYNLCIAAGRRHRLQWAHLFSHRAADHGSADALRFLANQCKRDGDGDGAERLLRQAADGGNVDALHDLAVMLQEAGDWEGAQPLLQQVADGGNVDALSRLALLRERAGDREGAENLAQEAAAHGETGALILLVSVRKDPGRAEHLLRQAADHGSASALSHLALLREAAGDKEGAEILSQKATDHGSADGLYSLALRRDTAGDQERAEHLFRQAADHGSSGALYHLAVRQDEVGDKEGAERLFQQAADHGDAAALFQLALTREAAGDPEGAETLALKAADQGYPEAPYRLVMMREEAGNQEGAQRLLRQSVDHGVTEEILETLWPHGLEPDGTPTPPWERSSYAPLDQHVSPGTP
ncbi:tetratricopeptide repeat protein [Streptomyces sp. LUP30]|uniref:tetratricopeptide repeat protein n=1 Tax=Streptomyces sp. LUP30 TaxID=1890285 RepID=UPI000AD2395A|nr:tetratricopeptide repeat protein [Streptomyces sp. LUP30]